jgi:predicted MFS family arabinose efflux permease
VFALAQGPGHVQIAMMLIGVGCSPVLMASYYIFARMYAPAVFASLAGAVIGIGALGNIAAALPMAWAVETLGWRETMWALAAVTLIVAGAILIFVTDPPHARDEGAPKGSLLDLLRMPALWFILVMMFVNYTAPAGLRGLWAGPFLEEVHGMGPEGIGWVTLAMGLSMVVGNLAYGPLDRVFGTRKWVVVVGNALALACLVTLWAMPMANPWLITALFAGIGLFGSSFPVIMAHGRSFFPPQLVGRGVTLVNMFGIGGVGLFQFASGSVFASASAGTSNATAPYQAVFLFFAVPLALGIGIYLFSQDRTD